MITEILAVEAALAKATTAAGLERGALPEGQKADMRYIAKQLKAAQSFVDRAKKKAQMT